MILFSNIIEIKMQAEQLLIIKNKLPKILINDTATKKALYNLFGTEFSTCYQLIDKIYLANNQQKKIYDPVKVYWWCHENITGYGDFFEICRKLRNCVIHGKTINADQIHHLIDTVVDIVDKFTAFEIEKLKNGLEHLIEGDHEEENTSVETTLSAIKESGTPLNGARIKILEGQHKGKLGSACGGYTDISLIKL